MNTASVVLPTAGICFKAAADMDRLAAAYQEINDVKMAERARGWAKIYRDEAAMGKGPRAISERSYGRARSNPDIGGNKPWPNIGNDGYLIGPRQVGIGGRRWTTHDFSEITETNSRGQMTGFGKLKPGVEADTDAYGNIMLNDDLRGDDEAIRKVLKHEEIHRRLTPGGRPGLIQDVRARAGQWGYNKSHGIKYLEEVSAEKNTGAGWRAAHEHAMGPHYEIDPLKRNVDGAVYAGAIVAGGNALGRYWLDHGKRWR